MNNTKTATIKTGSAFSQKLKDYQILVKFKLNLLVVFSAVMAYLIVAEGPVSYVAVLFLALGGFLVTGAANALNQVLEKQYDRLMVRTENRPLATGRMETSEAVMAAGFMSLIGIVFLALFNPWTAMLGMIALISYAFLYTPMKRVSPMAVFIGAIPGALPVLIGCTAMQGEITTFALVLFGIQFMWQFPHFWAIAWLAHEDYSNAGFYLLPSSTGERDSNTGWQSFIFAVLLIIVSIMPYFMGMTGILSAIILFGIGALYAFYSWQLYKQCNREAARKVMFCSFAYLPISLIVLYLDKI
ncbi:MAG: protoheme IX farnesyltransferase [Polaribacter sp.]